MNAKIILNPWLKEEDYIAIGQAVVNGYDANKNIN